VYLVWVPLRGAEEKHVTEASRLAGDPRVLQYWDSANALGDAYAPILQLSGPAWDVYLLFDRDKKWDGSLPPKPAFWMHQLGGVTHAPRLDATMFARTADSLGVRDP
jgi:hypothetical protein